ncbi:hypothetical protein HNQ91_002316 [Filimonas zeae]|uniref:Uncharacterized protein n=1 Tax=Filimonas zeae TaxID=1737353 RepID=A0A917IVH5_9BACT|nr:hypothetical protein [Filimonas zeae]MDR6339265.1 hypothetical protein [Filimonas zeae]GGH64383.1 hypothetical protein GCM10011379_16370 [Filimonas zeae]
MMYKNPVIIEYEYKDTPFLAWLYIHRLNTMEYLVETLTPFRNNILRLNHDAEWEENGQVTPLSEAIGRGIEKVNM